VIGKFAEEHYMKGVDTKTPYDKLTYKEYYEKYVMPEVPAAIKRFQDTQERHFLCATQGEFTSARNPKKDAERVAYREVGLQYCPKNALDDVNFTKSSLFCFIRIEEFCDSGTDCDVIERCKPINGVLFQSQ
jgi:Tfp pilus assembly protein PilE